MLRTHSACDHRVVADRGARTWTLEKRSLRRLAFVLRLLRRREGRAASR